MLNAGTYAGSTTGSIFEDGVESGLSDIGYLIHEVSESLVNVLPSTAYPIGNNKTLGNIGTPGYCATRSVDSKVEYIHVLNPPTGSLSLPATADASVLSHGLNIRTGHPVTMSRSATGEYTLTLDPSDTWSTTHTVIKCTRSLSMADRFWIGAPGFTSGNGATPQPNGGGNRYPTIRVASASSQQVQCSYAVPAGWAQFAIDLYWSQNGGGTPSATLSVTTSQCGSDGTLSSGDVVLLSGSVAQSGVSGKLAILTLAEALPVTPAGIGHLRLSRVSDAGAVFDVLGIMLRRVA